MDNELFYQMMTRLRAQSRAASTQEGVTRMSNNLIVTRPLKKPEIIDLQEYAKSGRAAVSVGSINKVKAIHDFINGRY